MIIRKFVKFFLNGLVLGFFAILLQSFFYRALGESSNFMYMLSSVFTYSVLICFNFFIQKKIIFNRDGFFYKFVFSNLVVMCFTSLISPLFKIFFSYIFNPIWGDYLGFPVAAIVISLISFCVNYYFVFK
jgi:hypothetical protein